MENFAGGARSPSVYFDAHVRPMAESIRSTWQLLWPRPSQAKAKKKAQDILRKTLHGIRPRLYHMTKVRSIAFAQALYMADMGKEADSSIAAVQLGSQVIALVPTPESVQTRARRIRRRCTTMFLLSNRMLALSKAMKH